MRPMIWNVLIVMAAPLASRVAYEAQSPGWLSEFSMSAADEFPSVDISPFLAPDDSPLAARRPATAAAWDEAMRGWGFARVTGHGVPPEVTSALRDAALAFFDLPLGQKRAFADPSGRYGPEGYTALGVESVGRTSDGAPGGGGKDALPDLVENLVIRAALPESADGLRGRPNVPPGLHKGALAYWAAMEAVLAALLRLTALVLGVPEALFNRAYHGTQGNALRFAHYPAVPEGAPSGQSRYGAHTDYQTYTLLMQDPTVGGLEVFKPAPDGAQGAGGAWVPVPPGGLVVNAGDLTELWVNGRWRSAMHRVSNCALAERRLSLAFFTGPRNDALIEPLLAPGEARRFEPAVAGEHLHRKLAMSNV